MYNEFSTANIQVDKDFSAKLSGYGCAGQTPEAETSNNSAVSINEFSELQTLKSLRFLTQVCVLLSRRLRISL